jgi:hypothetical protein
MYWPLAKSHKLISHEFSTKELLDYEALQIDGIQSNTKKSKMKISQY